MNLIEGLEVGLYTMLQHFRQHLCVRFVAAHLSFETITFSVYHHHLHPNHIRNKHPAMTLRLDLEEDLLPLILRVW